MRARDSRPPTIPSRAIAGYPFEIRIPTRRGFEDPKFITVLSVTNRYPGGFREDRGCKWFSGS